MRSKIGAGILAGLMAALVYGLILQVTTAPMSGPMEGMTSRRPAAGSHVMLTPEELVWSEAPSPPGARLAVLEGDPKTAGPFTFRLKLLPGTRVPVHTHPTTERVTVLSGAVYMGIGDTFRPEQVEVLPPGSVAIMPPGMRMYWFTRDETVIQINGQGPWGITYIDSVVGRGERRTDHPESNR